MNIDRLNDNYEWLFAALLFSFLTACSADKRPIGTTEVTPAESSSNSIVVYSSRKEHLIKPVFEQFTKQTGIAVKYATDKAGVLIERIKTEGQNTPADLLVTVDAGNLGYAAAEGIFQPINSTLINSTVAPHLRDEQDLWTGLSLRARTLVYSTERVNPDDLSTYQALGESQWQGRLCLRTSKKVYNQSLIAMLIAEQGEAKAEQTVAAWIANLAIDPTSNDTKVMQAIEAGQCDVGIVNSYYFGRLEAKNPSIPIALFWPNQSAAENSGVHVNISGAGILKHSNNSAQARRLLEWLASEQAQALFAGLNKEYPVISGGAINSQVSTWGEFKQSPLALSQAYQLQPAAVKLMDRVGYQ